MALQCNEHSNDVIVTLIYYLDSFLIVFLYIWYSTRLPCWDNWFQSTCTSCLPSRDGYLCSRKWKVASHGASHITPLCHVMAMETYMLCSDSYQPQGQLQPEVEIWIWHEKLQNWEHYNYVHQLLLVNRLKHCLLPLWLSGLMQWYLH